MRISLLTAALLSVMLGACATKDNIPPSKHISQAGPLKVHPDLLAPGAAPAPAPTKPAAGGTQ